MTLAFLNVTLESNLTLVPNLTLESKIGPLSQLRDPKSLPDPFKEQCHEILTPPPFMILTYLLFLSRPLLFICPSMFAYGLDFAEIFAWEKKLHSMSLTSRSQA